MSLGFCLNLRRLPLVVHTTCLQFSLRSLFAISLPTYGSSLLLTTRPICYRKNNWKTYGLVYFLFVCISVFHAYIRGLLLHKLGETLSFYFCNPFHLCKELCTRDGRHSLLVQRLDPLFLSSTFQIKDTPLSIVLRLMLFMSQSW